MKKIAFLESGQCVLVAFGSRPPDDTERRGYLEFLRRVSVPKARALIVSRGGALESQRRKEVDAILSTR